MDATLERNNRLIAGVTTILFGTLLILICLFIKFITPLPPFEESVKGGLEVNFGFDEQGMGNNNSLQPVTEDHHTKETTSHPSTSSPDDMLSSDDASNVVAPPKKHTSQVVNETILAPTPDQNLLNAVNNVRSTTGSNSGDGNTNTAGNQGAQNGTLAASVYSDFSGKGGTRGKLKGSGRKMIGDIAIYDDSQETGIVAVEILVDKYGKIIKAEPVLMGSTTTSSFLWKKAKGGLLNQVLFNQSPTGEEARGTIYINFTLR